jgi:hypothetical protein
VTATFLIAAVVHCYLPLNTDVAPGFGHGHGTIRFDAFPEKLKDNEKPPPVGGDVMFPLVDPIT